MTKTWVPKEIAGVRIPNKVRKAGARIPKSAGPLALVAIGSAIIAGIFAGIRGMQRSRSIPR